MEKTHIFPNTDNNYLPETYSKQKYFIVNHEKDFSLKWRYTQKYLLSQLVFTIFEVLAKIIRKVYRVIDTGKEDNKFSAFADINFGLRKSKRLKKY